MPKLNIKSEKIATIKDGITVKIEKMEIYGKLRVCTEYKYLGIRVDNKGGLK